MPIFTSPLCRGRPRPALLALALVAAVAGWSRGQARPDPVEDLKRVLDSVPLSFFSATPEEIARHEKDLNEAVKNLKTLDELGRAALLTRWLPPNPAKGDPLESALTKNPFADKQEAAQAVLLKRFAEGARGALTAKEPEARAAAAALVGEMSVASQKLGSPNRFVRGGLKGFAPDLVALLPDPDPAVRQAAVVALGQIEPAPGQAVPALRGMLEKGTPEVRRAAARALASLVTTSAEQAREVNSRPETRAYFRLAATEAVPPLSAALLDPNPEVSRAAVAALRSVSAATRRLVELPKSDLEVRPGAEAKAEDRARWDAWRRQLEQESKEYLALLDAFGKNAPDGLVRALQSGDSAVRIQARLVLEDLATIRVALQRAGPARGAAPRADDGLELVAWQQPQGLPPEWEKNVLPALIRGLRDPNVRSRLATVDALEALGADGRAALPALVAALEDEEPFVRWAALRTLGKIAQAGPEKASPELVVPAVARHLHEPDLGVRTAAAVTLTRYKGEARRAVPQLAESVGRGDSRFRIAAMRAVEAVGDDAAPALASVALNLRDTSGRITQEPFGLADDYVSTRYTAAQVLGGFGPLAAAQAPALRDALSDPEPEVRRAAALALLRVLGR